ncbi:MAG: ABC transporter permease [Vicinamibacterales bacterium]
MTPQVGRLLTPDDDKTPGASPVTVLSDRLWRRRFNADPSIVRQTIVLNGTPFTVVGVAPAGFRGTTLLSPELWAPLTMAVEIQPRMSARMFTLRHGSWMLMGGRLAHGVSIEQAQAEIVREIPKDMGRDVVRLQAHVRVPRLDDASVRCGRGALARGGSGDRSCPASCRNRSRDQTPSDDTVGMDRTLGISARWSRSDGSPGWPVPFCGHSSFPTHESG